MLLSGIKECAVSFVCQRCAVLKRLCPGACRAVDNKWRFALVGGDLTAYNGILLRRITLRLFVAALVRQHLPSYFLGFTSLLIRYPTIVPCSMRLPRVVILCRCARYRIASCTLCAVTYFQRTCCLLYICLLSLVLPEPQFVGRAWTVSLESSSSFPLVCSKSVILR